MFFFVLKVEIFNKFVYLLFNFIVLLIYVYFVFRCISIIYLILNKMLIKKLSLMII